MLATVNGSGATAKAYINLTDHLNGTTVVVDASKNIVETADYYPFGKIHFDNQANGYSEKRKYIGQEYDAETNLSYLNARYYNGTIGRFVTQDPVFWGGQNLSDPQSLNAYSYANNNPITLSDPSGLMTLTEIQTKIDSIKSQVATITKAVGVYTAGAANAWGSNNLGGVGRVDSSSKAFTYGQIAGDTISMAQGAAGVAFGALTAAGGSIGGGSLALVTGGTASVPAAAVVATGVAISAYGGSVIMSAGKGFGRDAKNLKQSADNLDYSDHAAGRAAKREVSSQQVLNTVKNGESFDFYHKGEWKKGYYDEVGKIFVSTNRDSGKVITVINDVSRNYINNLKSVNP